jgi:osmoprotectant transport system substrate-binding protein
VKKGRGYLRLNPEGRTEMKNNKLKQYVRTMLTVILIGGLALSGLWAGGAAEQAEAPSKGEIIVGSKIDTEGALLGNMIALVLEHDGFDVVDRIQTGATSVVRQAIISGEIDIYPEYTGNGFYLFSGETEADVWKQPQSAYEAVKKLDEDANNIIWLTPAPANNTWAIAVTGELAENNDLSTMDDLAQYISSGGDIKLAGSEEFVSSPAALPAFEDGYGFSLDENQLVVFSSGNTAVTEQAAARGTDGVNASMAYGTDGQLAALGLVVMKDTKGIQPVYEPAPIIRGEMLDAHPEIADLLEPVFQSLSLETLQSLNGRIAVNGEDPRSVAQDHLSQQGFLD